MFHIAASEEPPRIGGRRLWVQALEEANSSLSYLQLVKVAEKYLPVTNERYPVFPQTDNHLKN